MIDIKLDLAMTHLIRLLHNWCMLNILWEAARNGHKLDHFIKMMIEKLNYDYSTKIQRAQYMLMALFTLLLLTTISFEMKIFS